jgi:hypothetical protein
MVLCAAWCLPCASSRAAELSWVVSDTRECPTRERTLREIERLVGQALAEVEGLTFEVTLVRGDASTWRARIVTRRREAQAWDEAKLRELDAADCAQAADAAALAVAMTIGSHLAERERIDQAQRSATSAVVSIHAATPAATRVPWHAVIGLAAAMDHGALPELAWGLEGQLAAQRKAARITGLVSYFVRQDSHVATDARGGEFSLLLGALLGCGHWEFGRFALNPCGGLELGALRAQGIGLRRPRDVSGFWRAARIEAGVGFDLVAKLSLVAKLAACIPLGRPEFTVEDRDLVHRVAPVTLRALLGLEWRL